MVVEPKDIKHRGKKVRNKREFFRLAERIKIDVQKLDGPPGKTEEMYTNDISAGGIQLISRFPFRENSVIEITLNFKSTDPPFEPVRVRARVLRAVKVEEVDFYNVAVQYVDLDQKDRTKIERYIFMRQREMIAEKRIGFL